jgi:hypothetical protein
MPNARANRTPDDAQGLYSAFAFCFRPLFDLLLRPREYRICGVDDEP